MTKTLAVIFFEQVEALGQHPAMEYKDPQGQWRTITWQELGERVRALLSAFRAHGVTAGDRIAIQSTNCPQWVTVDIAAMVAGVVTIAYYPNESRERLAYLVGHSEPKVVFSRNIDLAGATLTASEGAEPKPMVVQFQEPLASGAVSLKQFLGAADPMPIHEAKALAAQRGWDELYTIQYTSGTTGPPKGAMLSHGNCATISDLGATIIPGRNHRTISYLPLSHIAERMQGVFMFIVNGNTQCFCESFDTLKEDLLYVRPTFFVAVPRVWEKFMVGLEGAMEKVTGFKKTLLDLARNLNKKTSPSALDKLLLGVLDKIVLSKLKAKLGLDNCQVFLAGAAPLSPRVWSFFKEFGIEILEVYGQTESTGVVFSNLPGTARIGTVGRVLPGNQVRINPDGEICFKGPLVFLGYFKNPEATAESIVDGWLHTGDVGVLDNDGFLKITDRKKDILITAAGKNVAPAGVEAKLAGCPGVARVVVVGDQRKFLTALVAPDEVQVKQLVTDGKLSGGEPWDKNESLQKLVQGYITEANKDLASYESIKAFRVLPHDLSIEEGELTPSQKVRRMVVQKKYAAIIDGMYPPE